MNSSLSYQGNRTAILERYAAPECIRGTRKARTHSITALLAAVMVAGLVMVGVIWSFLADPTHSDTPIHTGIAYAAHGSILIEGDIGFLGDESSTGVTRGSGTEEDPYVIEGWDIIPGEWGRGIWVRGASVHFIIQDCYIHDYYGGGVNTAGIYLESCKNATIKDNVISACGERGIWIKSDYNDESSANCSVVGNECSDNSNAGILTSNVHECIFSNNTCYGNPFGVAIGVSHHSVVSNNTCTDNLHGMLFLFANNSIITENRCSLNTGSGMILDMSNENTLSNNTCLDNLIGINLNYATWQGQCDDNIIQSNWIEGNSGYGVLLGAGNTNNRVWNNTFLDNNGASETYDSNHVQAADNGIANWWNDTEGYGNYWSDWTTPDIDLDGVVDDPYELAGDAAASDNYPLTTVTTIIPEFSSSGMLVGITLGVVVVIVALKRRERRT